MTTISSTPELLENLNETTLVKETKVHYDCVHHKHRLHLVEQWYYVKPFYYLRDMFGTLNVLSKDEYDEEHRSR